MTRAGLQTCGGLGEQSAEPTGAGDTGQPPLRFVGVAARLGGASLQAPCVHKFDEDGDDGSDGIALGRDACDHLVTREGVAAA